MHRGFADAEGAGGAAHGGTVFGDVQRQLQGSLVDVPFHTASLPVMILTGNIYALFGRDMKGRPEGGARAKR